MLFKRTPEPATDTVTIHVPNGPGCTEPLQVTHAEMRAVKENWITGAKRDRQAANLLGAYAKAVGE